MIRLDPADEAVAFLIEEMAWIQQRAIAAIASLERGESTSGRYALDAIKHRAGDARRWATAPPHAPGDPDRFERKEPA